MELGVRVRSPYHREVVSSFFEDFRAIPVIINAYGEDVGNLPSEVLRKRAWGVHAGLKEENHLYPGQIRVEDLNAQLQRGNVLGFDWNALAKDTRRKIYDFKKRFSKQVSA